MKRRHSIALNVILDSGPLAIMLAPERFLRWTDHRRAILAAIRDTFSLPARRVLSIEGLAGYPEPDPTDDLAFLERVRAAAAGAADILPGFHMFAWDDAAGGYRRTRAPQLPMRTGFIVVNVPDLKPGDRFGGCRNIYATAAEAEKVAGERLNRTRWVVEVYGANPPILGGGPRAASVGWTDTRHIVA